MLIPKITLNKSSNKAGVAMPSYQDLVSPSDPQDTFTRKAIAPQANVSFGAGVDDTPDNVVLSNIVSGNDAPWVRILYQIPVISKQEDPVLLVGESGTGKNLIARVIHNMSSRSTKPFVSLDLTGINPEIVESELFGHEAGAFTGAKARRKGLIEEANGGTLFIDEIKPEHISILNKLLRVTGAGEFRALGSDQDKKVDVRFIFASTSDLYGLMQKSQFPVDVYHRMAAYEVRIPPLRKCPNTLRAIIATLEDQYGIAGFTGEARQVLLDLPLYGNVRELKNILRRGAQFAKHRLAEEAELQPRQAGEPPEIKPTIVSLEDLDLRPESILAIDGDLPEAQALFQTNGSFIPENARIPIVYDSGNLSAVEDLNLDTMTQALLNEALGRTRGHKARAAEKLGVHLRTLTRMMRRYGIEDTVEA